MVTAKVYVYAREFDGYPKAGDLELVEEQLPPVQDGEFLAEALYLSVDPYMRAYAPNLTVGSVFVGSQVAKVLESKHPDFPVGKYIISQSGWRSRTVSKGESDVPGFPGAMLLPEIGDLPLSLGIGVLGMPGITAYFGFLEILKPKKGDTVIVSGAAGAVGSLVGQIAKIKGCKVIGVTGSDEKGRWLVEELGFDHFINYKTEDLNLAIVNIAPAGIDSYFDNVGGEISSTILMNMKDYGRISVCGSISSYNDEEPKASLVQRPLVQKQLRMEGFIFYRWVDRWSEGIAQLKQWIEEGKLKYKETVTEGFENMPQAFVDMLKGGNYGKAVVKV